MRNPSRISATGPALLLVLGSHFLAAPAAWSQDAPALPAFEVASVKVNVDPGRQRGLGPIQYSPTTLTMRGVSVWMSLRWAYGVGSFQISGPSGMQGPPFYDIVAKSSGTVPETELRLMLRTLLAERFHLAVHRESKEMPVTALLVAKGGPKFHKSAEKYEPERGPEAPMQFLGYDNTVHIQRRIDPNGRARDSYTNVSMKLFAANLELVASKSPYDKVPVIDMTGLQGRFDFVVTRDPPEGRREEQQSPGGAPPLADDPLAVYKRLLQNQLGLTLETRKAMVDVIVVDHVDKAPTPN